MHQFVPSAFEQLVTFFSSYSPLSLSSSAFFLDGLERIRRAGLLLDSQKASLCQLGAARWSSPASLRLAYSLRWSLSSARFSDF